MVVRSWSDLHCLSFCPCFDDLRGTSNFCYIRVCRCLWIGLHNLQNSRYRRQITQDTETIKGTIMDNWITLLLAFGIPVGILLAWYAFREFRKRLQWHRMWNDMENLADIDEGRERWHRFLREDGRGHEAALPKIEEVFRGIWKDTRERER